MNNCINKTTFFKQWCLLVLPLLLLCLACGKDDDINPEQPVDNPTPEQPKQEQKLSISLSSTILPTNVLIPATGVNTTENWAYVMLGEETMRLYARQDGRIVPMFALPSGVRQTSATNYEIALEGFDSLANAYGNTVQEVIESAYDINLNNPFEIMGTTSSSVMSDNDVFYLVSLTRSGKTGVWFHINGKNGAMKGESHLSGTHEVLFVVNKTNSPITFKHKGFDAKNKWYALWANVSLTTGEVIIKAPNGEANSEAVEVTAYQAGDFAKRINSFYVPNGNKIEDAQLIAEINGKEVRSVNRISSDVTLELGHSYGMVAVWDGENLTLGDVSGNGVIEMPEGSPINVDDITIMGDGAVVKVNPNGTFETTDNSIVALGKDDNIIYMSYASVENSDQHEVVLNSKETAITLLLPSIPSFMKVDTDETLYKLKGMVGELTETKRLADAIDNSIKRNGYFNINDIADAYQTAHNKILDLLGISYDADRPAMSMNRMARRASQKEPTMKPQVSYYDPIDLHVLMSFRLTKSTWQEFEEGSYPEARASGSGGGRRWASSPYGWHCEFTITNGRFATMAVIRGWTNDEPGVNYSTNPEYLFKNIIPAATTKNTIDRITSWDGYKEQLTLLKLSFEGEHFHGLDEGLKEEAALDFFSPTDGILAVGPADMTEIFVYNLLSCAIEPVIKAIGATFSSGGNSSGEKTSEERRQEFFTELMIEMMKAKTITAISVIMESDKSMMTKIEESMSAIWPVLVKQLQKQLEKDVTSHAKDVIFALTSEKVNIKELDKFFKEETKWIKLCSTAADTAFGLMWGSQETGVYVPMILDFSDPSGTIDIIPGFDI